MKLQHIKIDNLKLSPLNVRKHGEKNGDDLVPSIRSLGVLQPLLVRPNCEGFEIIAGQRRLAACKAIAKDTELEALPCIVMEEWDDAKAIEASLAENIARLPMDEVDQYEAFRDLSKQGQSVQDIAAHFGITERLVKQRLALGNLYGPILNAYRREEISPADLRSLTLASKSQQKAWYRLFKSEDEYTPVGYRLNDWLFNGSQIPVDNALFDVTESGLVIVSDLFGDNEYFADNIKFWECQSRAIASKMDEYSEDSWQSVILHDVGERWSRWDYCEVSQKDGGEVHITCAANGEIKVYEGLLTEKEVRKRKKAQETGETAPARPEITNSMQNYLDLHRHAAVRTELLSHAGIALRLAVAQIIASSSLWDVRADKQRANTEAISESLSQNKAQEIFKKQRKRVLELLDIGEDDETPLVYHMPFYGRGLCVHELFAKLLKLDDEAVSETLTFVVAETLAAGSTAVEVLGNLLSIDMADHWAPDDTFFDLLRDKEAINAMVGEVAGKKAAKGNVIETAKVQKQIIQKCLSGEREAEVKNWQPRYMALPAQGYTKRGGIEAVEQWLSVKKLFKAD